MQGRVPFPCASHGGRPTARGRGEKGEDTMNVRRVKMASSNPNPTPIIRTAMLSWTRSLRRHEAWRKQNILLISAIRV
jgi:hypothetical protein